MSKIGFRTAGYREWPLQKAIQSIAAIGFDGVELCLEHPELRPETLDASQCGKVAAMADDCGLEIASVSYHGDREDHAQRAQNQLSSILLTAALGARILILNGEHVVAGQAEVQWTEFVRHLRETLLPTAVDHGVLLALEPEPGMYLNGTTEMLLLLAECDNHPALGINLDIGHAWLTDADLLQSVRDLKDRIFHLH